MFTINVTCTSLSCVLSAVIFTIKITLELRGQQHVPSTQTIMMNATKTGMALFDSNGKRGTCRLDFIYRLHCTLLVMPKIHYTRFPVANLLRLLEMVS